MKMKKVFNGRLLKVHVMKRRLPHGFVATYEVIKHPGAALVVPFVSRDRVIMLRQLRPVVGGYIYEFVAGTLDNGEKPLNCAKREIIEETGYTAGRFKCLGKIHPVPGYSTEVIHIFAASGLKKLDKHTPEPDEVIESHVMTRAQVRRFFKTGRITDAKTIAALAMCGIL